MSRSVNVEVTLNEVRGDTNRLIKKFIKKVKKERVIEKFLNKRFYEKPSTKKRRQKKQQINNARKAENERNKKLDIR
jgi:ribosomal protein S21